MLLANGFKPAVLSRGYGGRNRAPVNIVSDGKKLLLSAEDVGDEALLIAHSVPGSPVLTGACRLETGKVAIDRFGVNVLLCDDAFQHRQMARNIDLVLLDCREPLSNGYVLPRGPLREPAVGLKRASCFILTRCCEEGSAKDSVDQIARENDIPVFQSRHLAKNLIRASDGLMQSISVLQGKKIYAFCGIAKPDSFRDLLAGAGANILSLEAFSDHYAFRANDLAELKHKFSSLQADYLVTTEKDFMRLAPFPEFVKDLSILTMEMEIIASPGSFQTFILNRLQQAIK